ncbi:MAG: tetratricopeptide repeat protein [Roseivirga sp.]|nr:tetratricopeptide repeat protein [Roseivirga sp.]
MKIKSSIFKYCILAMLVINCHHLVAQEEPDSARFEVLLDSLEKLSDQRKLEAASQLGNQLLAETDNEGAVLNKIRVLKIMFYVNGRFKDDLTYRETALECLSLSEQNRDYESAIICATNVALTFFNVSQYDSAKVYYRKAMEIARDNLPRKYPIGLANMAFIHGVLDQRDEELKYFMLALEVVEAHPEYDNVMGTSAMAYSGLGDYYRSIGEFDKAIENYEGKLKLGIDNDSRRIIYEAHYGLGLAFGHKDNYDFERSKYHFEEVARDTARAYQPYRFRSIYGLAKLYKNEKDYNEAKKLFRQALAYYKGTKSTDYMSRVQTEMADMYYSTGDLVQSRNWVNQAVASARKTGVIPQEREALRVLYRLDSIQGRYKGAFTNFLRYTEINDSLSNQSTKDRISELQIQYETSQTEKQNELLKADLDLQELRSQRQIGILIFVAVLSVVLVVSTIVFYRGYQRKKKDHDLIATQKYELKQLSDFKEGLTSMVVHDMKNPINSIIGFSRGTPDEKKMKKINQSGYNILNLVTNMLDIQRFEETKVEVVTEPVEGYRMVGEAANEVHLLLQAKSLRFDNLVPRGIMFNVERALLDRVMINLLTNAIKYSKLGEVVTVKLGELKDGFQELIVRDEGDGIAEGKLPYIFNKFWHKDARKSGLAPSTGLGLSFCKLAVEAHGGTIMAKSDLSKGTSMIFTLPLAEETATEISKVEELHNKSGESLSAQELEILGELLPELTSLEVHEVSAINKLISKLESKGLNKRWINALQASVYQGDQPKYNELLNTGTKEELI